MTNPQTYFEIRTLDYKTSKAFYLACFDWKIDESMGDTYGIMQLAEGQEGGLGQNPSEKPPRVIVYFGADDIDAKLAEIEAAGGTATVI